VLDGQRSRLVVLRHDELDADPNPNARIRVTDGRQNDLSDSSGFVSPRPTTTTD
jgi:hypothetical protein